MNIQGILIGLIAFLIIGIFHPIVIKGEYYFGKRIWPIFLVTGIAFLIVSVFTKNQMGSAVLGVIGFSCLWSIIELFEQEERVKKGWFPKNHKKINTKLGKH
ncbi:membrane protein [Clostridium novyi B str. ATCC 27606]|uniref:Membrane protein n=2 Tax=Clostridium TaxID=1485 RepID=A0AA40M2A4_CLONO|nr:MULTISPECIES: DUF4491 family protein [Clostridium]KEI12631.1 membrane protein [Clostridium novyi B str. NCTC 9691]KEI15507.1 membrane protein [Clostridium novyi B str. ATCC 27606]KEI18496.1 membrane protein [Clostridium haemolyticum NCTC 9693]KGN03943.1 membrane protein [Clostridium haemolyticum NCTC 8350]OOB75885.1 DUF4491 domain-containing protein [Clostridium haemolyticum]